MRYSLPPLATTDRWACCPRVRKVYLHPRRPPLHLQSDSATHSVSAVKRSWR